MLIPHTELDLISLVQHPATQCESTVVDWQLFWRIVFLPAANNMLAWSPVPPDPH